MTDGVRTCGHLHGCYTSAWVCGAKQGLKFMTLHDNPLSGDWTPESSLLPDPPYGINDVGYYT